MWYIRLDMTFSPGVFAVLEDVEHVMHPGGVAGQLDNLLVGRHQPLHRVGPAGQQVLKKVYKIGLKLYHLSTKSKF